MEVKVKKGYYADKILSQRNNTKMKTMEMKNSNSDKTPTKKKKRMDGQGYQNTKSSRFLITINVFGSTGPLRFIASGDDNAADVIETTPKLYAHEGRLPVLGFDTSCFVLYRTNAGFDAVGSSEAIGSHGVRNFVMCKHQSKLSMTEGRRQMVDVGKGSKWRVWLQNSLESQDSVSLNRVVYANNSRVESANKRNNQEIHEEVEKPSGSTLFWHTRLNHYCNMLKGSSLKIV